MVPPTSCMLAAFHYVGGQHPNSSPLVLKTPLHYPKLQHPNNPTDFLSPLCVSPPAEVGLWGCGQWPGSTQPPTGGRTARTSRPWSSACAPTITAWQARLKAPQGVERGRRLLLPELRPARGLQDAMPQLQLHPRSAQLVSPNQLGCGKAGSGGLRFIWIQWSPPACLFSLAGGRRGGPGRVGLCNLLLGSCPLGSSELRVHCLPSSSSGP